MVHGTVVAICHHGGEFCTNSDGILSYSGGEARAVDVSQDMLSKEFKAQIAATFQIDTSGWTIKYLLPGNTRVLISISSDKDLQRMVSYHKSAMSTEVFIINSSHNRGTMVGAASSGTSVVASSQNGKRRRPATGAMENKTTLLENPSMKHTATKAFNVAVDNARQNGAYIQSEVENIENRCYARLHPRAVDCRKKKCGQSNQVCLQRRFINNERCRHLSCKNEFRRLSEVSCKPRSMNQAYC